MKNKAAIGSTAGLCTKFPAVSLIDLFRAPFKVRNEVMTRIIVQVPRLMSGRLGTDEGDQHEPMNTSADVPAVVMQPDPKVPAKFSYGRSALPPWSIPTVAGYGSLIGSAGDAGPHVASTSDSVARPTGHMAAFGFWNIGQFGHAMHYGSLP